MILQLFLPFEQTKFLEELTVRRKKALKTEISGVWQYWSVIDNVIIISFNQCGHDLHFNDIFII